MLNIFFSDFCLSLLFNFKIGLSLGLSCLMSSMFTIISIIRIIKTTCFDNTILMGELGGKVPESRSSLSALNFPDSGYFHKTFATHFQKGSVYFYTKQSLLLLLYFWNYNLYPNGQIASLTDAQTHL